jgi:nucleotide-binding universal stress UspA family protein
VGGILVPVGGSTAGPDGDDEVVRLACSLAKQMHTRITFLHVIQVPRTLPVDADLPEATQRADALLLHAEEEAARQHVEAETALAQAREIGPAIVNEAIDRGAELVVVGIDPDRRSGTFHVGQIASYVLEHAPCAVIARRAPLSEQG